MISYQEIFGTCGRSSHVIEVIKYLWLLDISGHIVQLKSIH